MPSLRPAIWLAPILILFATALDPATSSAQAPPPTEQRRLEILGGMPRDQQLAPASQAFLQSFLRRGALLYLHRLDGLSCTGLFSLGDEVLFAGAVGNADGSERNLVFLEGAGAPSHLDGGPYVFPADLFRAYWPASPDRNTYWHECNHALLDAAGLEVAAAPYAQSLDDPSEGAGLRSQTALTSRDGHHPFLEGVGQRGSEAYAELLPFEAAARQADQAESEYLAQGRTIDYAVERQLWGEAHQRFSVFLKRMKRVANMPPETLGAYRQASGVFFSTAEQVAEFYRAGGMKRQQRGEVLPIRPPAWVFYPDLMLMPVKLELRDAEGRDLEQPGVASSAKSETKDGVYRQQLAVTVRARGSHARLTKSMAQNKAVGGAVARGTLRIRLLEDEPLVGLGVSQGTGGRSVDGEAGPGGPSAHLFDLDLSAQNAQPIRVEFIRRKLLELREPTTYHVELRFSDSGAERVYDASTAQVSFTLGPGAAGPTVPKSDAPAPVEPPEAAASTSSGTASGGGGDPQRGKPLGTTMSWGPLPEGFAAVSGFVHDDRAGPHTPLPAKGEKDLVMGPVLFFKRGAWGTDGIIAEFYTRRLEKPPRSLEERIQQFNETAGFQASQFKHSEVVVGGRKGFLSLLRSGSGLKINWVYSIELDPRQGLWVTVLTDLYVNRKNQEIAPLLERQHSELIASVRFGPDPSAMGVEAPEAKPLPKAFADEPIAEEELVPRGPPPKTSAPPSGRRQAKSLEYRSPGGYALTLPGTWSRRLRAGGAQLFESAGKRFVLACPDAMLTPPSDFGSFRGELAAAWKGRDAAAQTEARECGALSLLLVKTSEGKRNVWHLYAGSGARAVEFRVLGIAPAAPFPAELLGAVCGMTGVASP
ncbi:MAG: hypothetical protein HY901_20775 [Deltaproteobacteria bacterium]|nr:hypothetical protein [Deltaproteobacteria bacterium]